MRAPPVQQIDGFIERQIATGRAAQGVLVLITGDDDFTSRVRKAMDAGMCVEVLHPAFVTSGKLLWVRQAGTWGARLGWGAVIGGSGMGPAIGGDGVGAAAWRRLQEIPGDT